MKWLTAAEQRLWRDQLRLTQKLFDVLEKELLRDAGLSAADYSVLVPLSEAPAGVLRSRELRNEILWERSRLSHQVRRMEDRGLVRREECDTDGRGSMVRLTAAGRRAVERAAPQHVEAVRRYYVDVLSKDEIAQLTQVYERVLAGLE